ncbi:hypothetical protein TVAG_466260 [Trichomonas vaginalis G3]|uniref:DUF3447 domain-containing protein n=1 Tax=Trichomonas vaginalis (strain ATCC PRA-98 / G3) TaxID=412133 RepID=A2G601_TRIV3|nr:spectrin binding [Trichomonas vaginalis G3]EAX87419.1 hypothetical protein TVAG_466260 [Trichomonas vaginalis G3]KAI5543468.1 spectrin binding [Trichomonas vaginalis G3]|eukprot:XP_001300349.1 hypothetical protein [Trichomonas vaginalis G3]
MTEIDTKKQLLANCIHDYNEKMQNFLLLEEMLDNISANNSFEISKFILSNFKGDYNQIYWQIMYTSSIRHLYWEELLQLFAVLNKYHPCTIPILVMRKNFKLFSQCLVYLNVIPDEFNSIYGDKRPLTEILKYFPENSYGEIISHDDIDKLIDRSADINFKENILKEMPNYSCSNPLQFAAKYGSVNCFKFLMNNGFDIKNSSVARTAIAGGNLEIIRITLQAGETYKGCSKIAVQWHRNDVLEWLQNEYESEKSYCSLFDCIDFYNMRCLFSFLSPEIDFNQMSNGASLLYVACANNLNTLVKKVLIKYGYDVNQSTRNGSTPLCAVSQNNNLELAKILLKMGANPDKKGVSDCSPLFFACQNGNLDIVMELLNKGADIYTVNKFNRGVLFAGSHCKTPEILQFLATTNLNFSTNDGYYAVMNCCLLNKFESLTVLLENGALLAVESSDEMISSPLISAAENNSIESMMILIEKGADVNYCPKGTSPLIAACTNGNLECARLLIESGADINYNGSEKRTPLIAACKSSKIELVQMLLDYGAKTDYERILSAAISSGNYQIMKMISDKGCKVDYESDENIINALTSRNTEDSPKIIRFLLENGFNPSNGELLMKLCKLRFYKTANELLDYYIEKGYFMNLEQRDEKDQTPIYLAVGDNNCLQKLIKMGADVNSVNINGATALCYACQTGDYEAAKLLIDIGKADVNIVMTVGATALYVAAQDNFPQIVRLLCQRGAKVDLCAGNVPSPLYCAAKKGFAEIVKILLEYGADKNWHNETNSVISAATDPSIQALLA